MKEEKRTFYERLLGAWAVLTRLVPAVLFLGMCPGISLWLLTHRHDIGLLNENGIHSAARGGMLVWVAVSCALTLVAYFIGYRIFNKRNGTTFPDACKALNRWAVALPTFPIFIFLFSKDVASDHPVVTLFSSAIIGSLVALVAYRVRLAIGETRFAIPHARWVAFAVVIVMSVVYAAVISNLQILHHKNLGTNGDLAYYVNTLWNSIHGRLMRCTMLPGNSHITAHFDPVLILISPIMLISPRAETLMVFQAVWMALGTIPLYLIAVHQLKNRAFGVILAAVYLLHPAIHGLNMFDFHSISLAGPVMLWLLYLLMTERLRTYFAVLLFFFLFREDMPLLACLIGLWAILLGRRARIGVATIISGIVYFIFIKLFFMTGAKSYTNYFSDLMVDDHSLPVSILITLFTNPMYLVRQALAEPKMVYLLKLLVPVLGLPLLAGRISVLFLWGLGFVLMASRPAVFSIAFQYSIVLLPFFLASMPEAITRLGEKKIIAHLRLDKSAFFVALMTGVLASSMAVSAVYGAFFARDDFKAGYVTFVPNPGLEKKARYETVLKIASMIPDDASVSASGHVSPHFAARDKILFFREKPHADYVIVWDHDMRKKKRRKKWEEIKSSEKYKRLLKENGIYLYERKQEP